MLQCMASLELLMSALMMLFSRIRPRRHKNDYHGTICFTIRICRMALHTLSCHVNHRFSGFSQTPAWQRQSLLCLSFRSPCARRFRRSMDVGSTKSPTSRAPSLAKVLDVNVVVNYCPLWDRSVHVTVAAKLHNGHRSECRTHAARRKEQDRRHNERVGVFARLGLTRERCRVLR